MERPAKTRQRGNDLAIFVLLTKPENLFQALLSKNHFAGWDNFGPEISGPYFYSNGQKMKLLSVDPADCEVYDDIRNPLMNESEPTKLSLPNFYDPNDRTVSTYYTVFPLVRVNEQGKVLGLLGSCFSIAKSKFYMTAAHNFSMFQDFWNEQRKDPLFRKRLHFDPDKDRVGVLRLIAERERTSFKIEYVYRAQFFIEHDIAVLATRNPTPGNFPFLPLIEKPSIGQKIQTLGYPGHSNFETKFEDGTIHFDLSLVQSKGEIIELFPEGKDKVLSWYPCFETTAQIDSGQSGGPTLDLNQSAVVGVNSRSMDGCPSTIAWVGKILDSEFTFPDVTFKIRKGASVRWSKLSLRKVSRLGVINIL